MSDEKRISSPGVQDEISHRFTAAVAGHSILLHTKSCWSNNKNSRTEISNIKCCSCYIHPRFIDIHTKLDDW